MATEKYVGIEAEMFRMASVNPVIYSGNVMKCQSCLAASGCLFPWQCQHQLAH